MFCRVCGFRVRVWESCRTSRSCRYGYGSVTELSEVLGIGARVYITLTCSGRVQNVYYPYPGYCVTGRTELTEVAGTGMNVLPNLPNFFVGKYPAWLPRVWVLRTVRNTNLQDYLASLDQAVKNSTDSVNASAELSTVSIEAASV